jgi:hypothetical protein
MRQLRCMFIMLGMVLVLGSLPAIAAEMTITGTITNWQEAKSKFSPKAYLQLVKRSDKMTFTTDGEGLRTLDSNFSKAAISKAGVFKLHGTNLPDGEYLLVLQRATTSSVILVKNGQVLGIKVPGKFPLNLGEISIVKNAVGQPSLRIAP